MREHRFYDFAETLAIYASNRTARDSGEGLVGATAGAPLHAVMVTTARQVMMCGASGI